VTAKNNEYALIGHANGQLHVLDPITLQTMRQLHGHTARIQSIVHCAELDVMITGSHDNTARVWNVATGDCVHVLNGHTASVRCAVVHGSKYV